MFHGIDTVVQPGELARRPGFDGQISSFKMSRSFGCRGKLPFDTMRRLPGLLVAVCLFIIGHGSEGLRRLQKRMVGTPNCVQFVLHPRRPLLPHCCTAAVEQ